MADIARDEALGGIDDEIDEHLGQPRFVREDRWNAGELDRDRRAVPGLVGGHVERDLERGLDVRWLRIVSLTREAPQPADDDADPVDAVARLREQCHEIAETTGR